MNKTLCFLISIVALVMSSACVAQPAPGAVGETDSNAAMADAERLKTVIFDIDGGRVVDPENWNPYTPGSRRDQGYQQAMIEPLFVLNFETGKVEAWTAEEMTPNEDFTVWTLKLRDGVKWSDGEDFNADDVVFTSNMLLDNVPELSGSSRLDQWVESVEKVDDLTVQYNLKTSNPRFALVNYLLFHRIKTVPEHIWNDKDPLTFKFYDPEKGWPVFTGAYLLDSVSETEFHYVRNENWWGAESGFRELPAPEKLTWVWYGPEETRVTAMVNDELDSLMDITLGALLSAQERNPNIIAYYDEMPFAWVPDPCARTFEFNHTVEPWNDKDMRWAVQHAIDRDEIVEIAYEGSTFRADHFFPDYGPLIRFVDLAKDVGLYSTFPMDTYDPDKTREIFESKGYTLNDSGYYEKDGQELSMDITTHEAFIEKQRIAQVLVEQFQRIGINATTRNEAGGTWGENFGMGTFEQRMGWHSCGSITDPWASMNNFNTSWLVPVGERATQNRWRWSGDAADAYSAIIDEMALLPPGDPKIDDLFLEAMEIWMAELPIIPISQARKIIPFSTTYWTNWPSASNPVVQPPTWWDSTHLIIHNLKPAQ
ncbi:ABC transporter substrate-binding protein [Chloroflexi bacterium TSY]|nr:ABC transporter substrate-binding protein [Chloroflexi bacterium TSY]